MTVARDDAVGRRLLWLTVTVVLTISVDASTANDGDKTISGQLPPRLHLVGRVSEFEGQLNYYLPRRFRTHPERVNLVTRPLGFPLDTARLPNVMMGFFEHFPLRTPRPPDFPSNPNQPGNSNDNSGSSVDHASGGSGGSNATAGSSFDRASGESDWAVKLGCHGPPCPAFGSCTARYPNVQACWNQHLVDQAEDEPIPPINCPVKGNNSKWVGGVRRVELDESCSHREDFTPHGPSALQMMRLDDVFVTADGFTVNRTHVFVRNGCRRFWRKAKYEAQHVVHHLPTAVFNWAHQPGGNFYHFMVELVPLFLVAAPLMPSTLRHLPVLARQQQWLLYEHLGAPLIGIQPDQIRLLPTFGNDLFHANVVYQPLYQDCDHPSRPLWHLLRRRHLLHPAGLPLFNPDWTYRQNAPLSPREARAFPPDWVVVLAKRPEGGRRALVNFREVEEQVVRRFGRERVVVYNGSLPILQARELFRRTRLYIAGHGAALTNMIFMPEEASVLEIRPEGCHVTVFHLLASACSLRYHLVFSQGDWFSPAVANVTSVARVLDTVHARFHEEDAGGKGSNFARDKERDIAI
ncbi:hypothetical protein CLOM_g597 [Closterium sp. NIES-68]|nr:hypothetical protein CLOM_g597 [Closterium sp. NIES-68]GJP59772.1 hypothetical protein CLOP_g15139 [Closterium sp. NIES-67]